MDFANMAPPLGTHASVVARLEGYLNKAQNAIFKDNARTTRIPSDLRKKGLESIGKDFLPLLMSCSLKDQIAFTERWNAIICEHNMGLIGKKQKSHKHACDLMPFPVLFIDEQMRHSATRQSSTILAEPVTAQTIQVAVNELLEEPVTFCAKLPRFRKDILQNLVHSYNNIHNHFDAIDKLSFKANIRKLVEDHNYPPMVKTPTDTQDQIKFETLSFNNISTMAESNSTAASKAKATATKAQKKATDKPRETCDTCGKDFSWLGIGRHRAACKSPAPVATKQKMKRSRMEVKEPSDADDSEEPRPTTKKAKKKQPAEQTTPTEYTDDELEEESDPEEEDIIPIYNANGIGFKCDLCANRVPALGKKETLCDRCRHDTTGANKKNGYKPQCPFPETCEFCSPQPLEEVEEEVTELDADKMEWE